MADVMAVSPANGGPDVVGARSPGNAEAAAGRDFAAVLRDAPVPESAPAKATAADDVPVVAFDKIELNDGKTLPIVSSALPLVPTQVPVEGTAETGTKVVEEVPDMSSPVVPEPVAALAVSTVVNLTPPRPIDVPPSLVTETDARVDADDNATVARNAVNVPATTRPQPPIVLAPATPGQLQEQAEIATVSGPAVEVAPVSTEPKGQTSASRMEPLLTFTQAIAPQRVDAAAPAPAPGISIHLPVQHPNWSDAMAARVAWQVNEGIQQAHVRLNPPELGPVEVRVTVTDNQVNTQFVTHHGAVRQAVEDAMPRLREMLAQSGLNLADSSVFQHAAGREQHQSPVATNASSRDDLYGGEDDLHQEVVVRRSLHTGLIDAYV